MTQRDEVSAVRQLASAYARCESLARSHYENFPVASRLLPAPMRPHIAAVYAFARMADDVADEGHATAADRQRRLGEYRDRLHAAAQVSATPVASADAASPIFVALGHSIRTLDLPLSLFDDLLSAFGQDTMTTRYASWREVLDYCRRSANPVGRLVLRIAGRQSDVLDRSSDALCTALQLTNFWQDFGRDWRAGRLYVPQDLVAECGAREADLERGELTPAWLRAIGQSVTFTRQYFREGRAVCDGVSGRLKMELRLTWLGGTRILDRVDRGAAALLESRPTIGSSDVPGLLWGALRWGGQAA